MVRLLLFSFKVRTSSSVDQLNMINSNHWNMTWISNSTNISHISLECLPNGKCLAADGKMASFLPWSKNKQTNSIGSVHKLLCLTISLHAQILHSQNAKNCALIKNINLILNRNVLHTGILSAESIRMSFRLWPLSTVQK